MNEVHVAIVKQGKDAIARWRSDNPSDSFDLTFADLSRANLNGANLNGADLNGADLLGANLQGADLYGVDLRMASLGEVNLSGADLRFGANLSEAYLRKINLSGANLSGAHLFGADLRGANLSGANLSGAHLWCAKLQMSDLRAANLAKACLRDTELRGAELYNAKLSEADLENVKLNGLDLRGATLSRAKLSGTDFSDASLEGAVLTEAILDGARFNKARLTGARLDRISPKSPNRTAGQLSIDLTECDLRQADLSHSNLSLAHLYWSNLAGANFSYSDLSGAELSETDLSSTLFRSADLCGTQFTGARIRQADFSGANLTKANFEGATIDGTVFAGADLKGVRLGNTRLTAIDLSGALHLDKIVHSGPSEIGVETMALSKGRLPRSFLASCGLPAWIVTSFPLFDPELTPNECSDLLSTDVFMSRVQRTVFFGGAFISYSHADRQFVDQLHGRMLNEGLPAWLDIHDAVAGPMGKQITDTIRSRDVVILVLSQHSLQSDWVWHEIRTARDKEKKESRYILCPITLDDAWLKPEGYGPAVQKAVEDHQVEIGYLKDNNILPFHDPHEFDTQFSKLIRGIVRYYGRPAEGAK